MFFLESLLLTLFQPIYYLRNTNLITLNDFSEGSIVCIKYIF